jgi:hypothetical protein
MTSLIPMEVSGHSSPPVPAAEPAGSGGPGEERSASRWRHPAILRQLSLVPVFGSVLFNLVMLRTELTGVQNLNDNAFHLAAARWAGRRIQDGHSPLDGWFPDLALGLPLFHSYQTFPHVLAGVVGSVFGVDRTFSWSLYLLLAFWPLAVYASVRLVGLGRWTAAATGVVSGLVVSVTGYGFEHGSYVWRGNGLWSQLLGMWLFPLALALGWRAIHLGRSPVPAAVVLGLTIVCHLQTGYLAILGMAVFVLVDWRAFLPRVARSGLVVLGGLLTASYLLVPLALDSGYLSHSQFTAGSVFADSYGAGKVLGWLVSGELLDSGRWPVITALALVGTLACAARARHDARARALLGFGVLSLGLFFGRPTWGRALGLLPGSDELLFHRFISGVHLGGILLAGVGGAWLAQRVAAGIRRVRPAIPVWLAAAAAVCVGAAVLLPAWTERAAFDRQGARWIDEQVDNELTDGAAFDRLLSRLVNLPPGRVYAGKLGNWGRQYKIGQVPACIVLLNKGVDAIGFVLRASTLNADVEAYFDDTNPFQYRVLGIRYLVLPSDRRPTVAATLIDRQGRHTLWSVDGAGGYLQVVDTVGTITADRTNIAGQTSDFMAQRTSSAPYPTMAYAGRPAAPPTSSGGSHPDPAGQVENDLPTPDDGVFVGVVTANREAVVVLKATFSPRWSATIDGQRAEVQMIAPALIGVRVSPGRHTVAFRYQNFQGSLPLIAASALGLLMMGLVWRRWRWWHRLAPGAGD